ncbi:MAG: NAD(+) synthase [Lachnospiraceae bacterium]|nr:NAD(+) synthase [Lachnospiraceae bacterium]
MFDGFVKVATATPPCRPGDVAYNVEQICRQIDEAAEKGAKIIVFPELCLTGYSCGDLFLQQTLTDAAEEGLIAVLNFTAKLIRRSPAKENELIPADPVVFVGLPMELDGKLYNVAAAIQSGRILALIPKQNTPAYGEHHEPRIFTEGNAAPVPVSIAGQVIPFGTHTLIDATSSVEGLVIGCEICEDLWVYDAPHIALTKVGATVMVNLSASPEDVGKHEYRAELVRHASAKLVCAYLYASSGPDESTAGQVFSGHRMIAENGQMLAESEILTNGISISEIDLQSIRHARKQKNSFRCLSSADESYHREVIALRTEETKLTRRFPRRVFVPEDEAQLTERCRTVLRLQTLGLKKRLTHLGCNTVLVGVSGGLDSALALSVCCAAFDAAGLDRKGIRAVSMPCFGTSARTRENAKRLCEALGVHFTEIDLTESVKRHLADIGHVEEARDVTYENAQARERTQVLMDLANLHGGIVIGTGDLSELALGWCTYNGDQMSMYGVNAGVPKTLIPHLLSFFAKEQKDDALKDIFADIIGTPVSPELLPPEDGEISQKTEDVLGPYELHDFFLYYFLRGAYRPRKIFRIACLAFRDAEGVDEVLIKKTLVTFFRRFFSQQFKRSALPEGVRVGSVCLAQGAGFTMPSDISGQLWIEESEEL